MKVKICGITNIEDADYAIKLGADFIGVILDPKVIRHGNQKLIKEIKMKHPDTLVTGVYTSMPEHRGYEDYMQLHFNHSIEDVYFAKKTFQKNIISVIDFHESYITDKIKLYLNSGSDYVLLEDRTGITNRKNELINISMEKVGIAGKIDSNNVLNLMETDPDLIDVSSSLEEYPGKKSFKKMDEFFSKIGEKRVIRQN
ncbi:phosphoribosylanthranilate isomerase [Ferroplasma sp.]|uniref:phosphoribosylanthranilate isomerase n=1 Tax=Ferroplasma sp. TaxID=2591003 RepID=UPI00307D89D4